MYDPDTPKGRFSILESPNTQTFAPVQDHISTWHDRTGFSQDLNVILPLEHLAQMAEAGEMGAVAQSHYSFMGAVSPTKR
ncbi:MAG: hypothetical protein AAF639_23205 [Chloroflexota bacterium]